MTLPMPWSVPPTNELTASSSTPTAIARPTYSTVPCPRSSPRMRAASRSARTWAPATAFNIASSSGRLMGGQRPAEHSHGTRRGRPRAFADPRPVAVTPSPVRGMGPSLRRADGRPVVRFARFLIVPVALLLAPPSSALASQLIDRNATHVSIAVDSKHRAVVSYVRGGVWHHVLVWGAINARQPSRSVPQVKFQVDY